MIRHKCWGIGLGRTGTTSLCEALKILGYRQVFHNPTFEQLRIADGGSDNGVTIYYKYLDYKYPGSKFVLTTRRVDEWIESIEYITNAHPVSRETDDDPIKRRMILYESVTFDREKFLRAYARHHEDVRRYFRDRPNDLLEMDISAGQGWETLCPFLGLPVPTVSFPYLNQREKG